MSGVHSGAGLASTEVRDSGPSLGASVAEGYDRWAATYDSSPNPVLAREQRYLEPLLPDVSGKWVLDLGCGTGRWLHRLLARGAQWGVGVDFSAAMLQVASNKVAVTGLLTRADCCHLPFRGRVFDFAICSFTLGHIADWKEVARELARVMKPRAELFVSDLHPDGYRWGWRTGFRDRQGSMQIQTLPRSAEEMICIFRSCGFECLTHLMLCLGKAEEPIFARANKAHVFAEACRVPAILVCHFRRLASADVSDSPTSFVPEVSGVCL